MQQIIDFSSMLAIARSYLLSGWRNLRQRPGYIVVSTAGLALGIACFLLAFLYVEHEFSFDDYHTRKDRIYRVVTLGQSQNWSPQTTGTLANKASSQLPDVQGTVRIFPYGPDVVTRGERALEGMTNIYASPSIFDVFSFSMLRGDAEALNEPNTVVLTRSLAEKLFPETNPIGKTVARGYSQRGKQFEVVGIAENVPRNSHFTFDAVFSIRNLKEEGSGVRLSERSFWTYLLLRDSESEEETEAGLRALSKRGAHSADDEVEDISLQPLTEIFFSDIRAPNQGSMARVYAISAIAFSILIIAIANYVNLATVRSTTRTREVGVRKALGAHPGQIRWQFLSESLLVAFIALPVALLLLKGAIPFFNELAFSHVTLNFAEIPTFAIVAVATTAVVGLVSGLYPAFFLSGVNAASILGRHEGNALSAGLLRKTLIGLQFGATILFVFVSVTISGQIDYLEEADHGFEKEQIISVPFGSGILQHKGATIKQKAKDHPSIRQVAETSYVPGDSSSRVLVHPDPAHTDRTILARSVVVGPNYIEAMGIALTSGRSFQDERRSNKEHLVIINQAAQNAFGWEEAVGKRLRVEDYEGSVIGVTENFHFESLRKRVGPLILSLKNLKERSRYPYYQLVVRFNEGEEGRALSHLENIWGKLGIPGLPFKYTFLDDRFESMYRVFRRAAKVMYMFGVISIFLAGMGLFSLASFMSEYRTKEIGIRKALGASTTDIVALLSKEFIKVVILAGMFAVPVAYLVAERWLSKFAYHVSPGARGLIASSMCALLIMLVAVGYHALRAAWTNPADALRYE